MNTKLEILEHLKEILKMEGTAGSMYAEISTSVQNPALISFFKELAEEEKHHAEIVRNMISLLENP